MEVTMFVFEHGFGSIENQIEDDLNQFLNLLDADGLGYTVRYFPTGKGLVVVVEHEKDADED